MKIIADFHVHSRHSRATAKNLDLENLYIAAQVKGVDVVGSGDFCHPAWFAEIEAKLESAEAGLFKLKEDLAAACDREVPANCRRPVRFVLTTEISNIYKRQERTRKNHNLVLAPDIETAREFNRRLGSIGNIKSDGRPILGLDARDLLEVVLETSADACLIPAHIWTPWFSVLGSKSGFDSIDECFGDLAGQVFAAETGLSSDPAMNWRVSSLDRFSLVSNSDAHSPANIGREANCFDTERSYFALRDALRSRDARRFQGTIEFYPQEGKYHFDGHRGCSKRLHPDETAAHGGKCPVCGRPPTVGVLSRVADLADRPAGSRPESARPFQKLIPLVDILAEILQVGPKTVKAAQAYRSIIATLGPELHVLGDLDAERIERAGVPLLGEAIRRMRAGRVEIAPGFDGEYGTIRLFSAKERQQMTGQRTLFAVGEVPARAGRGPGRREAVQEGANRRHRGDEPPPGPGSKTLPVQPPAAVEGGAPPAGTAREGLNPEQLRAVAHPSGALLIAAGPGTGKTLTLTRRIAHLILEKGVAPESVLAVTFTNKAAEEMRGRLETILGTPNALPMVGTFHGVCRSLLRETQGADAPGVVDEGDQDAVLAEAVRMASAAGFHTALKPQQIKERIARAKQNLLGPDAFSNAPGADCGGSEALAAVYRGYQQLLASQRICDFEDLIFRVVALLDDDDAFRERCRARFSHLFVDEYQDINYGQYRFIQAIAPPPAGVGGICVIGDPDQSIYGFRGSDCSYFNRFIDDYPGAGVVALSRNYRSTDAILTAAFQVIERNPASRTRTYSGIGGVATIAFMELASAHAEAAAIAREIEQLTGGTGYHGIDTGQVREKDPTAPLSFADFAVLARTNEQLGTVAEVFGERGIPCQVVGRGHTLDRAACRTLLAVFRVNEALAAYADFQRVAPLWVPGLGRKAVSAFTGWCAANRLPLAEGLARAVRFPIPGLNRGQQLKLNDCSSRVSALQAETRGLSVREKLSRCARHPALAGLSADDSDRAAIARLIELAGDGETDAAAYLDRVALYTDTDAHHPRQEKVALLSMHAAKGLEFTVVFVAGCEDGLLPYRRPDGSGADPLEERRLFYVAMTRARERLYFTRARQRRVFGKSGARKPSPFIDDIERDLVAVLKSTGRRVKKDTQLKLF